MMIPYNAVVVRSDDASAICVFRKGNYQVELYLIYPEMWIRKHAHPRMDVIVMHLGGGSIAPEDEYGVSKKWGEIAFNLKAGTYHGGDSRGQFGNGSVTLTFQRWEDPTEITSAAIQWKGDLQGPIQTNLIQAHRPDALIVPNLFADVTSSTTLDSQ